MARRSSMRSGSTWGAPITRTLTMRPPAVSRAHETPATLLAVSACCRSEESLALASVVERLHWACAGWEDRKRPAAEMARTSVQRQIHSHACWCCARTIALLPYAVKYRTLPDDISLLDGYRDVRFLTSRITAVGSEATAVRSAAAPAGGGPARRGWCNLEGHPQSTFSTCCKAAERSRRPWRDTPPRTSMPWL